MPPTTTMKRIAGELGVSITTVSKVLNNRDDIGHATRARVLAKVAELGYQPNAVARSLTGGVAGDGPIRQARRGRRHRGGACERIRPGALLPGLRRRPDGVCSLQSGRGPATTGPEDARGDLAVWLLGVPGDSQGHVHPCGLPGVSRAASLASVAGRSVPTDPSVAIAATAALKAAPRAS